MLKPSLRRALVATGAVPVVAFAMSAPSYGTVPQTGQSATTRSFTATPLSVDSVVTADKAATSRLARTPASLLGRTDSTRVNVMIKYDYDSTATYAGGVGSLPATSPHKTGKKLTGSSAAERAYTAYQAGRERAISAAVRAAAPGVQIGRSFRVVYGGVQATVPADEVKDIVKVDGVVAVQPDELRQLLTDASSDFINATGLQNTLALFNSFLSE